MPQKSAQRVPDVRAEKRRLRERALARRAGIAADPPEDAPARVRCQIVESILPVGSVTVSGFWPMGTEINCRLILESLHAQGYDVCLPVVVGRGSPLLFRAWHPDMELHQGSYGEQIPPPEAEPASPDILLVPGLAFDRSGYRIGYGAGYYDLTLAALRAEKPIAAVGIAFGGQLVPEVPRDDTDEPLDWIVTEEEAVLCRAPLDALVTEAAASSGELGEAAMNEASDSRPVDW